MSGWDSFKKKPEQKPESREIGGMYQCQFCPKYVFGATYFPLDKVLKYKCEDGHLSFLEDFRVAF